MLSLRLLRPITPDDDFRKANDMDEDEDTFTDRFIAHIIRLFLEGCTAKNKIVRMRVLQCITEIIASLKTLEYVRPLLRRISRRTTLTTEQRRYLQRSASCPPGPTARQGARGARVRSHRALCPHAHRGSSGPGRGRPVNFGDTGRNDDV